MTIDADSSGNPVYNFFTPRIVDTRLVKYPGVASLQYYKDTNMIYFFDTSNFILTGCDMYLSQYSSDTSIRTCRFTQFDNTQAGNNSIFDSISTTDIGATVVYRDKDVRTITAIFTMDTTLVGHSVDLVSSAFYSAIMDLGFNILILTTASEISKNQMKGEPG